MVIQLGKYIMLCVYDVDGIGCHVVGCIWVLVGVRVIMVVVMLGM